MCQFPATCAQEVRYLQVFCAKNAGNFQQISIFLKFFISFLKNELRTTGHEIRPNFRIKRAGTSNYRDASFSPPRPIGR
jgi:hypothetical protein